MQNAMAIIAHALRMLVVDPATTFRVVLPALVMVMGSAIASAALVPDALRPFYVKTAPEDLPGLSSALILLLLGLVGLIGYALMAILWHRHVLLNGPERDNALKPGKGIVMGYLWRGIIVGLVQFMVVVPIAIVMAAAGGASLAGGTPPNLVVFALIGFLAGVVFIWVALRISVVLPAAALGTAMPVGASWQATQPASQSLWGVAAILAGLNAAVSLASTLVMPEAPGARLVLESMIYVIEGLIFISVLTTLYGHLIEHRPLDVPTAL